MKRMILYWSVIGVILLASQEARAANIQEGRMELAADANVSFEHSEVPLSSTNTTSGTIRVRGDYYMKNNISLGGAVFNTISKTKTTDQDTSNSNIFGLDGVAKYHFAPEYWKKHSVLQNLVPYIGPQAGWVSVFQQQKDQKNTGNTFSYGVLGGTQYFITENVSLNGELNYRHYKVSFGSNMPTTTYDVTKLLFGFSVYFF